MNNGCKNKIYALFCTNCFLRYFHSESFCPPKPATRKVFAFSASGPIIMLMQICSQLRNPAVIQLSLTVSALLVLPYNGY